MANSSEPIQTVFLDAAGTLFKLTESVGDGYARVAKQHGFNLDPRAVEDAFRHTWKRTRPPSYPRSSSFADREAIDRTWWQQLVQAVLTESRSHPGVKFDTYFADLYRHYEQAEAWTPFPGTQDALAHLAERYGIFVFSNFDERLLSILKTWQLDTHLDGILFSTALGASKPDPQAFASALKAAGASAFTTIHAGDDPRADGEGATQSGLGFFHICHPERDLWALVDFLKKQAD